MKNFFRKLTAFWYRYDKYYLLEKDTYEKVISVIDLLSIEKHWTKGHFARRANGSPIPDFKSIKAASWCLEGACYRLNLALPIVRKVVRDYTNNPTEQIYSFNDKCKNYSEFKKFLDWWKSHTRMLKE